MNNKLENYVEIQAEKAESLLAVVILLVFGIFAFQGADIETYAKGTTSKWTASNYFILGKASGRMRIKCRLG